MTITEALKIVLRAVIRITGSKGSPQDEPYVDQFLAAPDPAPTELFFRVGGIPLANFFAFSAQAFTNSRDSLWQEIQTRSQKPDLPEPSNWGFNTTLLQLAVYIQHWA